MSIRSNPTRALDLGGAIAGALNSFDYPEKIDEALVAKVLRGMADGEMDVTVYFLRALADAFDCSDAEFRLALKRNGRGRPKCAMGRASDVGRYVLWRLEQGVKQEAAVQEAVAHFKKSRSTVLRSLQLARAIEQVLPSLTSTSSEAAEPRPAEKSTKSSFSEAQKMGGL